MNVTVKWSYRKAKLPEILFETQGVLEASDAIAITEDLEKTGRAYDFFFIDDLGTEWTRKQLIKLNKEVLEQPHDIILYFDGNHNATMAVGGAGIALYYKQNGKQYRVRLNKKLDQMETNNEVEYAALLIGINQLEEMRIAHQLIVIRGDSQVVLNQLSGEWPCFEDKLTPWIDRIEKKLKKLGLTIRSELISRKNNTEAHKLASQALEGNRIYSTSNIPEKSERGNA